MQLSSLGCFKKKRGKELFYITILHKADTFPEYQGKSSAELSFISAALELGGQSLLH